LIDLAKSSNEIWEELSKLFGAKAMNATFSLKMQLFSLKMHEETRLSTHINELMSLLRQLAETGIKVDPDDAKAILLNSLSLERSIRGLHSLSLSIKGHFDCGDPPKTLFRASKRPRKSGTRKLWKNLPNRKNCKNEPVGIGGRPPKSIWISLVLYWIYQSPSQLTRVLSLEA
jgi:hypothetical protein